MKGIIELQNVWKTYKIGEIKVSALRNISISIKKNEFVAIIGPSGSGKSTLMHVVGALDIPTKGDVYLDSKNISKISESDLATLRGRKIGFVFQQFNLIYNLNALGNVMLPLELQDVDSRKAENIAKKLLEDVGLGDRLHHLPSQLSGGQQQRVAVARALSIDPEIILADEPTGNLDSKTGKYIMELLEELYKKGKTIILVTHDQSLIKHAKRVIRIKDGMIENELN